MKKTLIILIALTFIFTGYIYSQNCGACPSKSACGTAKAKKNTETKVFIPKPELKLTKLYHKKDCLKKDVLLVSLTEVKKKGYKPCQNCFPAILDKKKK